jgi:hypothetical protein
MGISVSNNDKAKEVIMPLIFQPLLEDLFKAYSDDPNKSVFGDDTVVNIISRELAKRFGRLD